MKRKLAIAIMSTLMVLSSVTGILAEGNVSVQQSKSSAVTISGASEAVRIDTPEDSNKLFISTSIESDNNGMKTFTGGAVSRDEFEKILDSLNKSEDKKAELLKQFDENLEINKKVNELYKNAEGESELEEINKKVEEIYKNKHNLLNDEIIEKALEMGIIDKINLEIVAGEKNGDTDNIFYSVKSN